MLTQIFFLLLLLFFSPGDLWAQSPSSPPASSEAGTVDKKISKDAREEALKVTNKILQIEDLPKEGKSANESGKSFFVRKIILQGSHLIASEELDAFLSPFEGRNVTFSEINVLTRQIEQEYRRRGYLTTLVYIPPQKIIEGTMTLEILEGKFGKLHVEGNHWFSENTVRRYWGIKENEPLDYENLQKSILRMNENPDRQVQAILRPGEETGFTDVFLKVKDKLPLHAGFRFDNQGTKYVGKKRFGFNIQHNNWIFPDSIFLAGTIFGKDLSAFFLQYIVPVTSFGTQFIFGFSHSQVAPKREFEELDVSGTAATYSLGLRQSLIEKESRKVYFNAGMDLKESRTRDRSGTINRERLRTLHSGLDFLQDDTKGTTHVSSGVSFGLRGLGASGENNPLAGRIGSTPDFIKFEGSLIRQHILPWNTNLLFKLNFQAALDKLASQEGFYLGGADSVRGYPEGDYVGDQGVFYSIEYLFPIYRQTIQGVAFLDQAYSMLRGASVNEESDRHLLGAGGGVRFRLRDNLFARLEVGHILGNEPLTESAHTRLHFQLKLEV